MTELTTHAMPAAVFWDMDGTLVDTEPYWMASEQELVGSFGGTWTHDDGLLLVGLGLWNSAEILRSRGVDMDEDAIVHWLTERVRERLAADGVPWRPGARELLKSLRENGVRTALVLVAGTATLASFINAGGLGDILVAGITLFRYSVMFWSAVLVAMLALLIEWLGRVLEVATRPKGI